MAQAVWDWNLSISRARRNTLGDILTRTAARVPNACALVYQEERLTYQAFNERVNETAHGLANDGVRHGDRVAVLSKNSLDFAVLNFALARIGAIMVPVNYMLNVDEIAYILEHAGVCALTASVEYASRLDQALAASELPDVSHRRYLMDTATCDVELASWKTLKAVRANGTAEPFEAHVSDEDVAQILYTSGTESRPKGVMLTHANLLSEYISCIVDGRMDANDVFIHALPLYHSAQLNCFLGPSIYVGATGIILPQASPDIILDTIEQERATLLFCPPTVWIALLRQPSFTTLDLTCLQKCYYGAAIMPMEVLKELSARLPQAKFWNFYGQTEVAPLATVLQPEDQMRKLGSAGRPALHVETRIVDEEGREVPRGTMGEIVHRTAHAMKGYLHDADKTAAAFEGGWFHSGDLGIMDEEGYLTVVDRKKDMIKTGGVNVSSREVEECIYQVPGVSEVAVIGIQDDYWIEAVTAVVVLKPGAVVTTELVIQHCRNHLAVFKVPKHVVMVPALPKNPSGKVLKRDLRIQYEVLNQAGIEGSGDKDIQDATETG